MASFVSSSVTTGEKRKKVVTYGKSSRLSIPPPRSNVFEEDAPSPERPRKHTAILNGSTAKPGGLFKAAKAVGNAHAITTSPDPFDVPSEDEFAVRSIKPAKRPVVQRSKIEGGKHARIATKDARAPGRPSATASLSSNTPGVVKSLETTTRTLQERVRPQQLARAQVPSSKVLPAGTVSQTKAPQSTDGLKQTTTSGQRLQRSSTSSKAASRATTPVQTAPPAPKSQSAIKNARSVSAVKAAKPTTRQPADLDVFDVPSSDEEASLPIPEAPRQIQKKKSTAKQLETSKASSLNVPEKVPVKSKQLGPLHNRKRKGSVSSMVATKPVAERMQEPSTAERDPKYPKIKKRTSPGHESTKPSIPRSTPHEAPAETTINKPRRTKTRTVPVLSQPAMSKGQSSPAILHRMVSVDQVAPKSLLSDVPASDDTMYEIPDPLKTPVRPASLRRTITPTPGSVTPRQKDLFSTLLGDAVAKTPASALASLQLTDKKPRSLLGALARSKSDLIHSTQSRKTRLIDTLRDDDTSSEDDESDSDEEGDTTVAADYDEEKAGQKLHAKPMITKQTSDDVEMNDTTAAEYQTSQVTSAVGRPRLTYAAQRSYLQETNPEDELFISMDLDDSWKMDSQAASTDDEDGPTSQVRTHHELKKYGQNTMFSWDMEESIRDISDGSSKSIRRSAMMELCTKMADAGFVSQLLDSGFAHQLLENTTSTGDVIFDLVAAVSVLFILQTKPAYAVVDQIHRSGITTTLIKLVDNDVDISRTARDRRSNMSKIAQESLADFCTLVLGCKVWSPIVPEKISPQLVALKVLDLLTRSLRESGSTEALLDPAAVSKLSNTCLHTSNRIRAAKASSQDTAVLDLSISVLETVSITDRDYSTWPTKVLQQLAEVMPVFFEATGPSNTVEAMKLCMNLTNNRPKACQTFSVQAFVQPLIHFIVGRFDLLHTGELHTEQRAQALPALTLSLGAMINLAELSDQARLNTIDDSNSIEVLVKTFLVGSERAAEADSVEESEVGVVVGFLTVLLGNLCLSVTVRSKVCASLPGQQLNLLLDKMKEFARIHEHVDKKTASRFNGPEGRETLNNYYIRIMHVVKELEGADL